MLKKIMAALLLALSGCNDRECECECRTQTKPATTYQVNYVKRAETTCPEGQCAKKPTTKGERQW